MNNKNKDEKDPMGADSSEDNNTAGSNNNNTNSNSDNNPNSSDSTVKPRRSARLLNKIDKISETNGRSKSPLKRAYEEEQVDNISRKRNIAGSTETESINDSRAADTTNIDVTQTSVPAQIPLQIPSPASTTNAPAPQIPPIIQNSQNSRISTSPPIFSISIGFGSMPPSFSTTVIGSGGTQPELPPEVLQMIENMTEGMQNGRNNPRPSTTTMFRSAGDGVGIGIAGISIPIGVMAGSTYADIGTNLNATNTDEFLNLARQMFQIISRGRSSIDSTPTSEEFATISEDLEPLLNDFFTRIVGGMQLSSAPAGLSFERIAQLPETSEKIEIDCSICREIGRVGEEKCVELPCKHSFHFDCIEPWLKRVSSCPICRKVIE